MQIVAKVCYLSKQNFATLKLNYKFQVDIVDICGAAIAFKVVVFAKYVEIVVVRRTLSQSTLACDLWNRRLCHALV